MSLYPNDGLVMNIVQPSYPRGTVYLQYWRCDFCSHKYESPTETVAAEVRDNATGTVKQACSACIALMSPKPPEAANAILSL